MGRNLLHNNRARWVAAISLVGLLTLLAFRYLVMSWPVTVIFRDHVTIPEGASAYRVARLLKDRQLIVNQNLFVTAVRLRFSTRSIRPGKFQLLNVRQMGDLVEQLLNPRLRPVIVTVPEGRTRMEIARFFEPKYPVNGAHFTALTEDTTFIRRLGLDVPTLEGYLFPDTYLIQNGDTEETIITQMVKAARRSLDHEIIRQGEEMGLTSHEIVTMASIIEGEVMYDSERVLISAVYHNRLRRGMRLQADPTVQYVIPDGPRRLYYKDYEFPSEYNTYLHKGLPPGPVNSPGRASMAAAVNPMDVDYLYFVADGGGHHVFTRTLEEHNRAVRDVRQRK